MHLFSIVQQIEYSYKPLLLEKTIAFENEVSKNCFIFVDLNSLKIILRNLLDNAIKFSPENSSIRFYSLDTPSEFHQFIIEDQGIGDASRNHIRVITRQRTIGQEKQFRNHRNGTWNAIMQTND